MAEEEILSVQPIDHIVSTVKGAIGAVPFAGPLLAEIAGSVIPNQRIDRLTRFAQLLGERLANVEEKVLSSNLTNPEFTDAIEEALRQASRATTDQRLECISNVLYEGISQDEQDFVETKHLLRILNEINDVEVIWLINYSFNVPDDEKREFQEKHKEVLALRSLHMGQTREELDKAAIQESYKLHLERLGLFRSKLAIDSKTKIPEFDKKEGFKRRGFEITPFGRLLVRHIWRNQD